MDPATHDHIHNRRTPKLSSGAGEGGTRGTAGTGSREHSSSDRRHRMSDNKAAAATEQFVSENHVCVVVYAILMQSCYAPNSHYRTVRTFKSAIFSSI